MIRRGIWLGIGAALGIAGYRRATRLVRRIGTAGPAGTALQPARDARALPSAAWRLGRQSASFVRDVRTGMAEYLDEHGANMNRHAGR